MKAQSWVFMEMLELHSTAQKTATSLGFKQLGQPCLVLVAHPSDIGITPQLPTLWCLVPS